MLTASGILDSVQTLVTDTDDALRAKFLTWLNLAMQKLAIYRDWQCLLTTATVTSTDSAITLPADFAKFISLSSGATWWMDGKSRLSELDAARLNIGVTSEVTYPQGFTQAGTASGTLTLRPSIADGSFTLKYIKTVPTYSDDTTATVWPEIFGPVLQRAVLDYYYEYDMDERTSISLQLDAPLLRELTAWENRQEPPVSYERHGYARKR